MASTNDKTGYPEKPSAIRSGALLGITVLLVCLGSGCSNSSAPAVVEDETRSTSEAPGSQSQTTGSVLPVALSDLQASSALAEPLPAIASVEVLANSGLQVAYTQAEQNGIVPALRVEDNWLHMQSCLQQLGVAPLVLVRETAIKPLTSTDDVIFAIDGIPAASATLGSIPVIQIAVSDFLMTGDDYAYYLRSIMGRLLWSTAGLSVRDYPYSCARQLDESL